MKDACLPSRAACLPVKDACRLIVMAKAPVAGLAKTRLIPALGANGAAALAERMLRHAVAQAITAGLGAVELCVTPSADHHVFKSLCEEHSDLSLALQASGDIGQRMAAALQRHLALAQRVLLMGSDLPAIDAAMLRQAAQALGQHDAVFVPALDGGYGLIGLTGLTGLCRTAPPLFEGITWSTDQVMRQTLARATDLGLRTTLLNAVADIDRPADLAHLPAGWLR